MGMSDDYKISLECDSNLIKLAQEYLIEKIILIILFPINYLFAIVGDMQF